ncbi:MAG TPA: glycosyltransferase family 39 protein, partial [Terriglobales bacterium]|nr:glycosyltransferase family 39 protein [Terriglobales bacterium]
MSPADLSPATVRRWRYPRLLLPPLCGLAWLAAMWGWDSSGYAWSFWLWLFALAALPMCFAGARPRPAALAPATRLWFGVLLLLGLALRLPSLSEIPPNIAADEILPGHEAMHISAGNYPNVFSSLGWFTIPGFAFLPPALVMQLLPDEPFYALRLSSLLTGMIGLCFTFLLARRLFNDRIALVTLFLMAVGFWHVHNSRTGFPFIQTSTFVPLVLYLLVRARQHRSLRCMALAGIALGFALQGYFPVRALMLLVPLFLVVGWIGRGDSLRRIVAESAIAGTGMLLVLFPLLSSVDVSEMLGRSQQVLITRPAVAAELSR